MAGLTGVLERVFPPVVAPEPAARRLGVLGEIAGRYQLRELIGRGGMGEVHAGWDRRLERPVAIKTLRADVAAQPSARRRFESEARSAARLVHPNVVAVYDSGEDHGIPFMVMELLPASSLKEVMAKGPMDVPSVRSLAAQVLGALGAAHAAGIVHRDIKPANILMAGDGHWKVGDFGIAKSVQVHGGDETMTGMVLGTPAYLAPERLFGSEATPGGDLYSLGVILYEALAARRPFQADTPEGWAAVISAHALQPLRELRPDLPPAVASAIDRSIARDPASRFSSASEMADAMGVGRGGSQGSHAGLATAGGATDLAGPRSWHEVAPATPSDATAVIGGPGAPATRVIAAASPGAAVGGVPGSAPSGPDWFGARWSGRRRGLAVLVGGAAVAGILGLAIASAAGGGRAPATTHATTPTTVAPTLPATTLAPTTVAPRTTPPPPPPHHKDGGPKGGPGGGG